MKNNVISHPFREVFRQPSFVALACISAVLIGAGVVWLSGYRLILFAFDSDIFDGVARLKILWTSLGMFATNFTLASQVMIVTVAIMAGVNIAMLCFYFKKSMAIRRASGASALGLVIGTFGVGCSACGSVVLSSFLGITTASALVSWLPLRGAEFGIASIVLVGTLIYILAKKIQSPAICAVKKFD